MMNTSSGTFCGLMPAYLAADGLRPKALIW